MPRFGFWTRDEEVTINGPGGQVILSPRQAVELAWAVLARYSTDGQWRTSAVRCQIQPGVTCDPAAE